MRILKKILPFLVVIIIWQSLIYFKLLNEYILPSPVNIFKAFTRLAESGELFINLLDSVKRVSVGFLIASFLGVGLGIIAGYFRKVADVLTPLSEFLRPIPPIAWIPIAILWFGLGDRPAYFIVFVGAFFPIFINCYWGIRESRVMHLNVAQNFGASRMVILTDVLLPGSLPRILHGLRIGLGFGWTSVIAAELVGAQSGLGYMIQLNRIMLRTENIIAGMISIGIAGLIMNYLMLILEKRLTYWNEQTTIQSEGLKER